MSDGWVAGGFKIKYQKNDTGDILERETAGWIKQWFALDFRVYDMSDGDEFGDVPEYSQAWCLTHIPTGFVVTALAMPLDEAKDAADFIAGLADWSFEHHYNAKQILHAGDIIKEKYGDNLARGPAAFSPNFTRA